jgi:hypothetical protein
MGVREYGFPGGDFVRGVVEGSLRHIKVPILSNAFIHTSYNRDILVGGEISFPCILSEFYLMYLTLWSSSEVKCQCNRDAVPLTNYLLKEMDISQVLESHREERLRRMERVVAFGWTNGRLQMDMRWWDRPGFRVMVSWCRLLGYESGYVYSIWIEPVVKLRLML